MNPKCARCLDFLSGHHGQSIELRRWSFGLRINQNPDALLASGAAAGVAAGINLKLLVFGVIE